MIRNLNKNRFWFWKALETYGIGVMFIIRQNTISFYPPRPSLLIYFDDPPFIFLMEDHRHKQCDGRDYPAFSWRFKYVSRPSNGREFNCRCRNTNLYGVIKEKHND